MLAAYNDRVYADRMLTCIVVGVPVRMAAWHLIIEDAAREPMRMAIYDIAENIAARQLQPGQILRVAAPYFRICADGSKFVRVDDFSRRVTLGERVPLCWRCSRRDTTVGATLSRCGKCKKAMYCDSVCQTADWKAGGHKFCCKWLA